VGLLAERVGDRPLVIVVDQLEQLDEAPRAQQLVASLIRHRSAGVRIVLISRSTPTGPIADACLPEPPGLLEDASLALTSDEAGAIAARLGADDVRAGAAAKASAGWVTGLRFELLAVDGRAGDAARARDRYLSTNVLGGLSHAERDFLIQTAPLDRVTAARAGALGVSDAARCLARLEDRRLLATWRGSGTDRELTCHPCLRELLLTEAAKRAPASLRRQALAHSRLTAREREYCGELVAAVSRHDFRLGTEIGDALARDGGFRAPADESPSLSTMLAWCYFHVGQPARAREVAAAGPSRDAAALDYMLSIAEDRRRPGDALPQLTGGLLDGIILRVHFGHGYLGLLRKTPTPGWAQDISLPWRASALGALGQTTEAERLLFDEALPLSPVHALNGIDVLIDLGRGDEAEERLDEAHDALRDSGSVFLEMYCAVLRSRLSLHRRRDPQSVLRRLDAMSERWPIDDYHWTAQQLDAHRGLALLRLGAHERAAAALQRSVETAIAGDRILELPAAATLLSEARWHTGDEQGADWAADVALTAARRQGSNHLLLQALSEFPAVATRRVEADADAASEWRAIARLLARAQPAPGVTRRPELVLLNDLGAANIVVNGAPVNPGLRKALELLAYLLHRPGRQATTVDLFGALFDGRDDRSTQAYLRQAIYKLRATLPHGLSVSRDGDRVSLVAPDDAVVAASARFEAELDRAARLQAEQRLERLTSALALADAGPFLRGVETDWVVARRRALDQLADDARLDAAEIAFHLGRYNRAERLLDELLTRDRFRERGWQLQMRIGDHLGDADRMISAFRRCRSALAEVGLKPTAATRRLLEQRLGPGTVG
jgi:DNA-binding SARP family transcriptional activator